VPHAPRRLRILCSPDWGGLPSFCPPSACLPSCSAFGAMRERARPASAAQMSPRQRENNREAHAPGGVGIGIARAATAETRDGAATRPRSLFAMLVSGAYARPATPPPSKEGRKGLFFLLPLIRCRSAWRVYAAQRKRGRGAWRPPRAARRVRRAGEREKMRAGLLRKPPRPRMPVSPSHDSRLRVYV